MKDTIKDLKVVVVKDGEHLVAQCLDYDFAVQAPLVDGLEALKSRFARVLAGFIIAAKENGIIPFERLKLAPLFFWKLWISDSKHKQVEMAQVDLTEKEAFLSSQNIEAVATFLVHL